MFNEEKNGYSKNEVNMYIVKLRNEGEEITSSLRAQIAELKNEISELKKENELLRYREDSVKDAMVLAAEKSKEMEEESRQEFLIQTEKLKQLYYKYVNIIDAVQKKYGLINPQELNAKAFYNDIENLIDKQINREIKREEPKYMRYEHPEHQTDDQKIYHKQLLNRMSGLLYSVSSKVRNVDGMRSEQIYTTPQKIENNKLTKPEQRTDQKQENITETKSASKQELKQDVKTDKTHVLSDTEKQYINESVRLQKIKTEEDKQENFVTPSWTSQIKPILNLKESAGKGYSSLLEKYLNDDTEDELASAYAQKITSSVNAKPKQVTKELNIPDYFPLPNESGFDLREAVNPKESLEDIMKAFDFFDENKDNKQGKK